MYIYEATIKERLSQKIKHLEWMFTCPSWLNFYICIHTHTHAWICVHLQAYMCFINVYIYIYVHTYMHIYMYTYVCKYKYTYTRIFPNTYLHIHIRIHTNKSYTFYHCYCCHVSSYSSYSSFSSSLSTTMPPNNKIFVLPSSHRRIIQGLRIQRGVHMALVRLYRALVRVKRAFVQGVGILW